MGACPSGAIRRKRRMAGAPARDEWRFRVPRRWRRQDQMPRERLADGRRLAGQDVPVRCQRGLGRLWTRRGRTGRLSVLVPAFRHAPVGPVAEAVRWRMGRLWCPAAGQHRLLGRMDRTRVRYSHRWPVPVGRRGRPRCLCTPRGRHAGLLERAPVHGSRLRPAAARSLSEGRYRTDAGLRRSQRRHHRLLGSVPGSW